MKSANLIKIIQEEVKKAIRDRKKVEVKYAKVDPAYASGRPYLIFDGESSLSGKTYPYLSSYSVAADDRVQVVDGVIQGKIV